MSSAKLTLIGLNDWMKGVHDDLFGGLILPNKIDKNTFIDTLLLEDGEFCVLYPDPDFMKEAITKWGTKWNRTFTKWQNALDLQYDPIANYDRKEEVTDIVESSGEGSTTTSTTGKTTTTTNGKTTNKNSGQNTGKVSAYDSENFVNASNESTNNSGESTNNNSGEDNSTMSGSGTNTVKNNSKTVHTASIKGNIGVTTSQQMLQSELDIAYWNLYKKMSDIFTNELLIAVY